LYDNHQSFHIAHKPIIWNHNVVYTINSIMIKNHFTHFLSIFSFFSTLWWIFFAQIYYNQYQIIWLFLEFFFGIWFLWVLAYHNMQKIAKILHNNDIVEVQAWYLSKKYNIITISTPHNALSPLFRYCFWIFCLICIL